MWTTIGTAVLSAAAALGGVGLSSMFSTRSQNRQRKHEQEQRYREERLKVVSDFVTRSTQIRRACLNGIEENHGTIDFDELRVAYADMQHLSTRLRLTARRFETAHAVLEVVDDAALVIGELQQMAERSEKSIAKATLWLAAMRLREEYLVSLARDELGLGDLAGMPSYDEEITLRAFLHRALHSDEAVEQMYTEIQRFREKQADSTWLAR